MNTVEMQIREIQTPPPIEWNKEEIKQWLTEILSQYDGLVYSEEQLKDAKADKAKLNKLRKALNDERIRYEKEYLSSFKVFKGEVDELLKIIDSTTMQISVQLEEADNRRKEEKTAQIEEFWNTIEERPEWLQLARVWNEKWLNASYSMNQIKEDLVSTVAQVNECSTTLSSLPEYAFEAMEEYKRSLDINRAIAEGKRLADIQKRKLEAERIRNEELERRQREAAEKAALEAQTETHTLKQEAEEIADDWVAPEPQEKKPKREWISFSAYMTFEEAMALKIWLDDHRITFKPV